MLRVRLRVRVGQDGLELGAEGLERVVARERGRHQLDPVHVADLGVEVPVGIRLGFGFGLARVRVS